MAEFPLLLIILGTPASGKTTLARALALELEYPCFCKDDIKEALFETLGTGNRDWSRRLSEASFGCLSALARAQIAAGLSCIVEGNWRPAHAPDLLSAAAAPGARTAQVWCCAGTEEIERRFTQRQRHPGHLDGLLWTELAQAPAPAPAFLELPGPRWVYPSDLQDAYRGLLAELKSWGL
jgi:predicted kinase